ncbi:hypothetical protein DdX_00338 [Ditylenchus destructor]|uniref:Uncharacterized protein n=1 Tax=Ditylenchus destructor TaxID=166010 RepID=A0AAD4NGU5_9BILA|nr:hypothetical protein DdX_00338 [Ditylenchus destructor]
MIVQLISKYCFYFVLLTSLLIVILFLFVDATSESTDHHDSHSARSITPTLTSGNIDPGSEHKHGHSLALGNSPGRGIEPVNESQEQESSANKKKSELKERNGSKQRHKLNTNKFNLTKAPKVKNGNILDDIHSREVGFGYDEMLRREIDEQRPILRSTGRKALSAEAGKPSEKWTSVEKRNVVSLEGASESFESETEEESFEDLSLQETHSDKENRISTNESSTPIHTEESVLKSHVPHPEQMSDFYELERKTLQDLITAYEDHIYESKHDKGKVPDLSSSGSSSGSDEIRELMKAEYEKVWGNKIPKRKPRNWADWQYMTMNSKNMSMQSETIDRSAHKVAVNSPRRDIKQSTLQTENMKHCSMEKKMRLCDIHPSFDLLTMKFELCTHIIYEGARILYERKGLKKEDGFRLVVRQRKTQRKVKRNKRTKRDRMLNQLHELKRADQELWLSINLHFTNKPALNALIEEMIANDEKRQIFFNTSTNVAEQGGYSGIVVHRAYPGVQNDDSFIHFLRLFKFHLLEHNRPLTAQNPGNRKRTRFEKKETKRDIKLAVHMMGTLDGMNFTMKHPYAILSHMEFIIVSPIVKENYWDEFSNNVSDVINPLVSYTNEKAAHNLLDKLMEEKLKNNNFVESVIKGNKTKSYKSEDIEQAQRKIITPKRWTEKDGFKFDNKPFIFTFTSKGKNVPKYPKESKLENGTTSTIPQHLNSPQKEDHWSGTNSDKVTKTNAQEPPKTGDENKVWQIVENTPNTLRKPTGTEDTDHLSMALVKNVSETDTEHVSDHTESLKQTATSRPQSPLVNQTTTERTSASTDKRDPSADSMALVKYRGDKHRPDNMANGLPRIILAPKTNLGSVIPFIAHRPYPSTDPKTMALVKYKGEPKQATQNAQHGPSAITQHNTNSIATPKGPQLLLPAQKLLTFPGYENLWAQPKPVSNAAEAKETTAHSEVDQILGAKLSTSNVTMNDDVDNSEIISEKDVIDSIADKTKQIFYEFGGVFFSPHHDDVHGECRSSNGEPFHLSMMILKEEEEYYQKHNLKKSSILPTV